jgi:integrase
MALYRRNQTWWITLSHGGRRVVQQSAGTTDKKVAQHLHDKLKADLWKEEHLNETPPKTWREAAMRWLNETQHKRSTRDDKMHLRWLDAYLGHLTLPEVTRDVIDGIIKAKTSTHVKPSTVNRVLSVVRTILRKAEREWDWLDKAPLVRMQPEEKGRIRWLTREEATQLLEELPCHLRDMATFTLATGLRRANVTGLKWADVDLVRCHALIHPDQAKAKRAIPVPLNADAIAVLQKQIGKHSEFVFTYRGKQIIQCTTKAWYKALERIGISKFKWHDLRHTWASWHVQNGTPLHTLQQLGGWASYDMVLRYAHLSSDHLRDAAERISATNLLHRPFGGVSECVLSH